MKMVLASGWPGTEAPSILSNMEVTLPLISYFYAKKDLKLFREYKKPLYLDSGVFTARKKGKTISIKDLITYYKKNEDIIDWVFNLDEGDPENQLNNCKIMKKAGLNVIGIFHGKKSGKAHGIMNMEYLDRFAEVSNYVALGSLVPEYFDSVFEYIDKRNLWPLKIHALGTERLNLLDRYPFYSSDSSAFQKSYTYGLISENVEFTKLKAFHPKDNLPKALKIDALANKMIGRTYEARDLRIANAVLQREVIQKYLTNLWIKKGIVWD